MGYKIYSDYIKPLPPKPVYKPEEQKPQTIGTTENGASKKAEQNFAAVSTRAKLEKQLAAKNPSPAAALDQIENLPKPDASDQAAVKTYKQERARIADNAVNNSEPPKREDYQRSGLNGPTADAEYRDAKSSHDAQVRELRNISAEAARNPDTIVSPDEAVRQIDALPRPDRNDPNAVREYNNQRAQIADDALMYAEPPKREDYTNSGLNPQTADYEYREAAASYQTAVGQLEEHSDAAGSSVPPPMNEAEAERAATDLINRAGGAENIDEDGAYGIGRDIADLAETDPEGAILLMNKTQEKLDGTDQGDNVASGFTESVSDANLRELGRLPGGSRMMGDLRDRLLAGNVNDGEYNAADKLYRAIPSSEVDENGQAANARNGAEAAARLQNEENYIGPEGANNRARDFQELINIHKGDTEFLQQMYESLGAEETAKLIDSTVQAVRSDNRNEHPSEATVRENYAAIAESLSHTPESFQYEVGAEAARQGDYEIAIVLAQSGENAAAKRGFLDNVKDVALGDDDYQNAHAARMAGEVLASDPQLVREYLADRVDSNGNRTNAKWSPEEVTKLFENGLAMPPLSDNFHHDWSLLKGEGLERVVGMAGQLTGSEYGDFRARVFRDAAAVLSGTDTGDRLRQSLVDNLQTLFEADPRGITDKLFNNTGAAGSPFDSTGQALSLFFREALFANPDPNSSFVTTVSELMGDLRADMLNPANLNRDPNNERYAKILGDVLGSVAAGYQRAVADNGEDQAAREALVGTVVDLIAKPLDAGGTIGGIAKDQATTMAKSLFSDFLNGDLKADEEGMRGILDKLFENAFAGARDFDSRNHTNIETSVKVETIWVDYLKNLFE